MSLPILLTTIIVTSIWLVHVAFDAVDVVAIAGGLGGPLISGVVSVLGWVGALAVGVILAGGIGFLSWVLADEDEGGFENLRWIFSALNAVGITFLAFLLWIAVESWVDFAVFLAMAIPFAIIAALGFWYFQHRQQVASQATAIRRTRRTARRRFEGWSELVFGVIVVVIAVVFGILGGAMEALSSLGDTLLPWAPEFAYLGTVLIGYVALGGEMIGSWLVPDLSPMQYAGITLFLGGLAIMVRQ